MNSRFAISDLRFTRPLLTGRSPREEAQTFCDYRWSLLTSAPTRLSWACLAMTAGARRAFARIPTDEIPPLSPPLPEIAPTAWEQFGWVLWILVPLLLVMVAAVVWLVLRPGKPPVLLAPAGQARVALQALQSQTETGEVLSQISQVMRRYLVNAFWLSPLEMTTHDFCELVRGTEKIDPGLAGSVAEFLQAVDQRKFAPATMQPPLGAASRALELIELAEGRQLALPQPTSANPKP